MVFVEPVLRPASRHHESQTGSNWRTAKAIAGRGREGVTPSVNGADVRCVGRQRAGYRFGLAGGAASPGLVRPGIAGVRHLGICPVGIDLAAAQVRVLAGQQAVHWYVNEVGVAVVGVAV